MRGNQEEKGGRNRRKEEVGKERRREEKIINHVMKEVRM